jgi:hypothetical protein
MFKNLNIFRPLLAVLILFIPLYPKFPLFNISGTYVAIRLEDIVIAIIVLTWLIFQIKYRFPILKQKISWLFIVYFVAITVSFINALLIYQTEPSNILLLHLVRRFEYMSLFFVALQAVKSLYDFKFYYLIGLLSAVLVSVYGYGQKYFNFPIISTMNSEFSKGQLLQMNIWTRISATFAGHYDLAAYLSVILIIILGVALISKNKYIKVISLLVWLPIYQIFTFTASRISTFAFLGGIVFTLFFLKKYLWIIPVTGLVIFSIFQSDDLSQRLLATIPAFKNQFLSSKVETAPKQLNTITPTPIATATPISPMVAGKISPTPTIIRHKAEPYPEIDADVGVARSGEIRFNAEWPRAITAFKRNPLVGSGPGSITLATDNDYLRNLGETGLFGIVTFGAIFIYFIKNTLPLLFKKNKSTYNLISIIFFGGMLTTLANALFIDVFEASKTAYLFWIMMALYYQSLNLKDDQ